MSSNLKAIIFDFDGVVLESASVKTEAFCELYAEYGQDVVAKVREHHLANLGISRFKKFDWIAQNILRCPLTADESTVLGDRFSALAFTRVLEAPFVRGAREALVELCGRYPLFVASGTPQQELDMIVDRRELRALFREVHGTPRDKPTIIADIARRHGFGFGDILFVGDGISDYEAARVHGLPFLARDTADLHDRWVELAVVRLADLTELVGTVAAWA